MAKLLTPQLPIRGNRSERIANVLIDTGASFSFVRRDVAEAVSAIIALPRPLRVELGDGSVVELSETAILGVEVAGLNAVDNFIVMPQLLEEVVLGAGTMRKYALKLDMETSAIFAALEIDPALPQTTDSKKTAPFQPSRKEFAMNEHLNALCLKFGIDVREGMTDEQAAAAIEAKAKAPATVVAAPAVLAALGVPADASLDQVHGKILSLTHRADVVPVADFNALKAQLHEREKADAVRAAVDAGKLYAHEVESWRKKLDSGEITLAAFNSFIADRHKLVPIGEKPGQEKKEDPAPRGMSNEQREINRQLHIDDATFAKYAAQ